MKTARALMLTAAVSVLGPTQAFADITAFLGANTTPESRRTQGFAVGAGVLLFGFEFEYSSTREELSAAAPSLKVGSGNLLIQSPFPIFGFQPYFTTGGGLYRETLAAYERTGFALNTGGGVKISLAGPVRLRIDYRILKLGDDALESSVQRLYAGLNLKF